MCGEKRLSPRMRAFSVGSPPRVRGKDSLTYPSLGSIRITPACAGKRSLAVIPPGIARDHPRVCGEKDRVLRERGPLVGSPPRVRGKVLPFERPTAL